MYFQGIRPENPDRLPSFPGIPHRLPRPTGTAVPDGKYDIRMVYHIPVPFPQTVRRVLPLQHRLLVTPLCDGKVAISQGFRPPYCLPLIFVRYPISGTFLYRKIQKLQYRDFVLKEYWLIISFVKMETCMFRENQYEIQN